MLFPLRVTTRLVRRRNNFTTLPSSSSSSSSTSTPSSSAPLSTQATPPSEPAAPSSSSPFTLRTPTRNRLQKPQRRQASSHTQRLLSPSTPSLHSVRTQSSGYTVRTFTSSRASRTLSHQQSVAEEVTIGGPGTSAQGAKPAPSADPSAGPDLSGCPTHVEGDLTIINPRNDEDGKLMVVQVTERAKSRLRNIVSSDPTQPLLRITVSSGGCHGFQYLMSLDPPSTINPEEDTIIDCHNGARLVMDEASLELLKGSKVDYVMELIGSQFKIVGNPRAVSNCGCGTSFDIQF